jgi:SSS family transporter
MFQLGPIDILVLVAYLASAVLVGLLLSGRNKNVEAFLLGDRNLPWWAILGSIVATETSAATVLSVPGEGYGATGMKFLQLALGYLVGRALIVMFLLPLYFRGQLMTAYEVLDRRFGSLTRQASSVLFLIARNLGDGLRLLLAAIVLQKLVGWPFEVSVLMMGIISTVYTFVGGMRSVIWNDCIQFAVYVLGGILSIFVIAASVDGGIGQIVRFGSETGRLAMFDFSLSPANPYTFWAGLIGGAVLTLGTHGTDHSMVQRYLSARSQADASRALLASGAIVFLQFAMFLFIGIGLACFFGQHADEVTAGLKRDEVFAHFIVHHFPYNTGLVGLMLAAILAANLSSSLSASAAAVVNDLYLPHRKSPASPQLQLWLTRALTLAFGVVQIAIGIWAKRLYDLDATVVSTALTVAGFVFGLLLGVFALGVFTPRAGQAAALAGGLAGLAVLLGVQFLLPKYGVTVAFPWLPLVGLTVTLAVGWLVSLPFPARGSAS